MNVITRLILQVPLLLIGIYQRLVSPLLPNRCRFTPTCSEYTRQAIERYGFKGLSCTAIPGTRGALIPFRNRF